MKKFMGLLLVLGMLSNSGLMGQVDALGSFKLQVKNFDVPKAEGDGSSVHDGRRLQFHANIITHYLMIKDAKKAEVSSELSEYRAKFNDFIGGIGENDPHEEHSYHLNPLLKAAGLEKKEDASQTITEALKTTTEERDQIKLLVILTTLSALNFHGMPTADNKDYIEARKNLETVEAKYGATLQETFFPTMTQRALGMATSTPGKAAGAAIVGAGVGLAIWKWGARFWFRTLGRTISDEKAAKLADMVKAGQKTEDQIANKLGQHNLDKVRSVMTGEQPQAPTAE